MTPSQVAEVLPAEVITDLTIIVSQRRFKKDSNKHPGST